VALLQVSYQFISVVGDINGTLDVGTWCPDMCISCASRISCSFDKVLVYPTEVFASVLKYFFISPYLFSIPCLCG
jgi:hypothetical protein